MNPTETVILCEGYHDRAFWQGWLLSLGCRDAGIKPGVTTRIPVKDLNGRPVTHGQFGYYTPSQNFVRVVPCGGKDKIRPEAERRLDARTTNPYFARIVINTDTDMLASDVTLAATGIQIADVLAFVQSCGITDARIDGGEVVFDGDTSRLSLIRWETADAPTPGVPDKQTLERLVCASVVAAYRERGKNVQEWLNARHTPPTPSVKEYTWSLMAGWRADGGCDDFLRSLWDDERIAAELMSRLKSSGAWRIVEEIVL